MTETTTMRNWLIFEGILFLLLGFAAIALPGVMTLSLEFIVGILFIISGLAQAWRSFQAQGLKGFFLSWLSAILYLVTGILFLVYPLSGVLTLTLILATLFLVDGIFQIYQAFNYKRYAYWGWRLLSGLMSLLLALIIFLGLPGTAIWTVGLLVGINMVFFGVAQLAIAWHLSNPNTPDSNP